jgi:hypothetical protein
MLDADDAFIEGRLASLVAYAAQASLERERLRWKHSRLA